MTTKGPKNAEKSFGVSVGIVLLTVGALLWWRGRIVRAEIIGGVGSALLLLGVAYPPLLKWPSAAWWRLSRALGYVNARVLLTVLFAFLLVPLSFVWRLAGKDPLTRRRDTFPGWSPSPVRYRNPKHYERMF